MKENLSKVFSQIIAMWENEDLSAAHNLLSQVNLSDAGPKARELAEALEKRLAISCGESTFVSTKSSFGNKVRKNFSYPFFRKIKQKIEINTILVITPIFNAAHFIDEAIESVIGQNTACDIIFHIQDGGSTDGTVEKLKNWEKRIASGYLFKDRNVYFGWATSSDSGMYDAINKGLLFVESILEIRDSSKIIMTWLNADDLLAANSLATVDHYFTEFPEVSWITGIISLIDENGAIKAIHDNPKAYSRELLKSGLYNGIHHPCFFAQEGTFWKYSLFKKAGGLNPQYTLAGDWALWKEFAAHSEVEKLDAILALHRRHSNQLSADSKAYYEELGKYFCLELNEENITNGVRAYYDFSSASWNKVAENSGTGNLDVNRTIPSSVNRTSVVRNEFEWPKISVVTPSYNQGVYIEETIISVMSQGYPNLEYIIIDGGSSDDTVEVIRAYEHFIKYWVSESDKGQSDAINKGFKLATGDILTWLNSDDQFAPDALFNMATAFKSFGADLVAGICEVFENGSLKHRHQSSCSDGELPLAALLDLDKGWNAGQFFYQPEVFFTRDLWERAGAHVREDCYYSMDYELWCRFAAVGANVHVIGAPIVHFRSHPEQKTADPSKFKSELVNVRERFVGEWLDGPLPSLDRPPPDWSARPCIVLINDHGFSYGAGIANKRIAASLDMAGYEVESFSLKKYLDESLIPENGIKSLFDDLNKLSPDVVIFGNIHSQIQDSIEIVSRVQEKYQTFWITHDFWIFTGRCAYVGDCKKYLTGCSSDCPTSTEYPQLDSQKISKAWLDKRQRLSECKNLTILANSDWAHKFSKEVLGTFENNIQVDRIKLGVPVSEFSVHDKTLAKRRFNLPTSHFTIAFSVSSLSDRRKGGEVLLEAIQKLGKEDISIILIGHCDADFDLPEVNIVRLGYIEDSSLLVWALNAADVFVGPSREETLGQVFLEAAMCGTPSIGFAGSGVDDAIKDGVTGVLVKERTPKALSEAISRLYQDRVFAQELSSTTRSYAVNEFSVEASYRSFFHIFRKHKLVDKWAMPHKISFEKTSRYIDDPNRLWFPLKGISTIEGPYLEQGIDHEFRWCYGNEITLRVRANGSRQPVILYLKNTLFDHQQLDFFVNDILLDTLSLKNDQAVEKELRVVGEHEEWIELFIVPKLILGEGDSDNRKLSFMLLDVREKEII